MFLSPFYFFFSSPSLIDHDSTNQGFKLIFVSIIIKRKILISTSHFYLLFTFCFSLFTFYFSLITFYFLLFTVVGCIFAELLNMQSENVRTFERRRPLFPGER